MACRCGMLPVVHSASISKEKYEKEEGAGHFWRLMNPSGANCVEGPNGLKRRRRLAANATKWVKLQHGAPEREKEGSSFRTTRRKFFYEWFDRKYAV